MCSAQVGVSCVSQWGRRHEDRLQQPVGATMVGAGAEELALPLMLLMNRRLPLAALGSLTPCRNGPARLLAQLAH